MYVCMYVYIYIYIYTRACIAAGRGVRLGAQGAPGLRRGLPNERYTHTTTINETKQKYSNIHLKN